MKSSSSRRDLLKIAGLGTIAAASGRTFAQTEFAKTTPPPRNPAYKLGLASYTTRELDLDKTIAIAKRLHLEAISLKQDFHLPMNLSADKQKAIAQKVRDSGLDFYACGVIYTKTEDEVKKAFEFAKNVGIRLIVGVPNHELLDLTEQMVKEYDIAVAIHNHGPTDKLYPTPSSAYELIKNRDKRIGVCVDVGHTQRCGTDPSEEILKVADRLADFHLKDVTASEDKGETIEMGRGVIDIPKIVRTLDKIGYNKNAAFEFEKDPKNPLPGLAETVGFYNGVIRGLQAK
jgi:sugar phosphate isomerase/epimerase